MENASIYLSLLFGLLATLSGLGFCLFPPKLDETIEDIDVRLREFARTSTRALRCAQLFSLFGLLSFGWAIISRT